MKKLYLMRHAKSSWEDLTTDDFERPLNKRGKQSALLIGEWMVKHAIHPDIVICSSALRTTKTLRRLQQKGVQFKAITISKKLYIASAPDLLQQIQATAELYRSLMIIGHNPGLQNLVKLLTDKQQLTAEQNANYRDIMAKFPTAGFVQLSFDNSWNNVTPLTGKLNTYIYPKALSLKETTSK